jgi:hypothetical protein
MPESHWEAAQRALRGEGERTPQGRVPSARPTFQLHGQLGSTTTHLDMLYSIDYVCGVGWSTSSLTMNEGVRPQLVVLWGLIRFPLRSKLMTPNSSLLTDSFIHSPPVRTLCVSVRARLSFLA